MHAKIYVRVSTQEQAEKGYSIDTQVAAARKLAAAQGCFDPEIYIDEGYSGEFLDRPGLNSLRDSLRHAHYDGMVIFFDPDRLARNLAHQLIVTSEIEKAGAQLKFVSVTFENSPEGKLFYSIRGAIAAFEKEKIKERTQRGKRGKALAGLLVGSDVPLGYDRNADMFTINEPEAAIIRKIFSLCTKNRLGTRTIARELNLHGCRTKNGKRFYMAAVYRILTNPQYKGCKQAFRFYDQLIGQKTGKKGRAVKITKRTCRPTAQTVEIPVPAIVAPATWDEAQKVLRENRTYSPRNAKRRYLLSGLLRCGYCGRPMVGATYIAGGRTYQYYQCSAKQEDGKCANRYTRIATLETEVWGVLRETALTRNELPAFPAPTADEAEYRRMLAVAEDLKARQALIVRWVRDGSLKDLAKADKDIMNLGKEIELAQATLYSLAAPPPPPNPKLEAIPAAETFDRQRAILQAWGLKIYVKRPASGKPTWHFGE